MTKRNAPDTDTGAIASSRGAISASEARSSFNDVVNRVSYGRERVTITRQGKPVAVVVSVEDVQLLERLEDAYWGDLARERREQSKRAGEQPRSWRDVRDELDLE